MGKIYDRFIAVIKEVGEYAKVLYSVWYVTTDHSAEDVCRHLLRAIDLNDKVVVIDATNNAMWWNLVTDTGQMEAIKTAWEEG